MATPKEESNGEVSIGTELLSSCIELMKKSIASATETQKKDLETSIIGAMSSSSLLTVTADKLKLMLANDYIEDGTRRLLKDYRERKTLLPVRSRDVDLVEDLFRNWDTRGIKHTLLPNRTTLEDGHDYVHVELSY